MARRAFLLIVTSLFAAASLVAPPSPAAAGDITVAHTISDPYQAVETWFPRHGISPAAGITVMRCESGANPGSRSRTGKYVSLFQHDVNAWPGRVARYNAVNDLKTPDADWRNPTTVSLVTAWMVKNDGGWRQWACKPSRS